MARCMSFRPLQGVSLASLVYLSKQQQQQQHQFHIDLSCDKITAGKTVRGAAVGIVATTCKNGGAARCQSG